jgi:hypothetical protein
VLADFNADDKDVNIVLLSEMGCPFIDSLSVSWKLQLIGNHKTTLSARRINIGFPKGSNRTVRLTQGVIDTKGRTIQ